MTVTVAQAIRILSKGKYVVGPEGTISTEDAATLEELLADEVSRKDPGFSSADLVRFKAYLMLDLMSNTQGIGAIVEKKVNLVSWKIARSSNKSSTSMWMDYALNMLSDFGVATAVAGVSRCDSDMKGLDSTDVIQYGEPSYTDYGV